MFMNGHLKLDKNARQKFIKIIYTYYYLMNKSNINYILLQRIINKILYNKE